MGTVKTDLAIIGAGPSGLYAAFEAGRHGMAAHIVDVLERPGGQCAELYPAKPIYDIPGLVSCTGAELTNNLLTQIERFQPIFHMGVQATSLMAAADTNRWLLGLSDSTIIDAAAVVIAAGAGSFEPRRIAVPGAEAYEGTSLLYAVKDVEQFRGKRTVIVGGGDSAVDWALALRNVAAQVTVVHRRDVFRAAPSSVAQLKSWVADGSIGLEIGSVVAIEGEVPAIRSVVCELSESKRITVPCDRLLVLFGLTNRLGPVLEWGMDSTADRVRVNPVTMETSLPGVFAVGDVSDYPGKLKLILCGFHEAALMGQAVFKRIHGEAPRFEYSTHSKSWDTAPGVGSVSDSQADDRATPAGQNDAAKDWIVVTDRQGQSHKVPARPGMSLLELIMAAKIEIKGSCYGACNCSTCHVYVDEQWFSAIPSMLDQEQEALDQVSRPMPTSRLACQIEYQPGLTGMHVQLSEDTRVD